MPIRKSVLGPHYRLDDDPIGLGGPQTYRGEAFRITVGFNK